MMTAEALTGKTGPKLVTADGQTRRIISPKSKSDDDEVCLTKGCVQAASKMLDQMDENVEPCDDFCELHNKFYNYFFVIAICNKLNSYTVRKKSTDNFACGSFVDDTIIPDDKVSVNTFSVISDKLQEQLRTIVTAPIDENEIEPFKNVKRLYIACMNKSEIFFLSLTTSQNDIKNFQIKSSTHLAYIEERGLTPLQDIHESMGGWPVVKGDAWEEKLWTWQQSVKEFRKRGYSTDYIFDFSVGTDLKNSTRRIIDVS